MGLLSQRGALLTIGCLINLSLLKSGLVGAEVPSEISDGFGNAQVQFVAFTDSLDALSAAVELGGDYSNVLGTTYTAATSFFASIRGVRDAIPTYLQDPAQEENYPFFNRLLDKLNGIRPYNAGIQENIEGPTVTPAQIEQARAYVQLIKDTFYWT
jgi:hypothetical protein